jgi:hypothetical protein
MLSGAPDAPGLMEKEWALLRLSWLYARAMDRNEPDILRTIFTADAVLEGEDFTIRGVEAIVALPAALHARYSVMMHTVHNQTVAFQGDRAEGETYCIAHHIMDTAARGGPTIFDMGIRYRNQWQCPNGSWRFSKRKVILDWTEIRAARRTMTQ